MTKKMNRLTVKGWSDLRRETEQKEAASKQLADDLEALRKFRSYLLNNNRGEATLALRSAVDDYAGFLTGRCAPRKGARHGRD